ncbi:MAG: hypothetical protein VR66_01615 [Peptococcaceae bacterium BRH_c23]|nr:MAG: hypothetical protein VR66_01615 [Peptococcaceae bacterium BRH_c23]KJS88827.1 MAG: hypothetical protein JL57_10390 [Desulfosporosinus sp. BICA1-9]HBW37724.1 hypothetical protein [Desulfosporosinus sp.]
MPNKWHKGVVKLRDLAAKLMGIEHYGCMVRSQNIHTLCVLIVSHRKDNKMINGNCMLACSKICQRKVIVLKSKVVD